MQRYILINEVTQKLRCDQAQTIWAKNFQIHSKSKNIKLFFALVDNHISIKLVERMIQTLKLGLGVMRIDHMTPFKFASNRAEIIKTLRITPH